MDVLCIAKIPRKPYRNHTQVLDAISRATVYLLVTIQENAELTATSQAGVDCKPPFSAKVLALINNDGVPF